jgi:hypothetical protein
LPGCEFFFSLGGGGGWERGLANRVDV